LSLIPHDEECKKRDEIERARYLDPSIKSNSENASPENNLIQLPLIDFLHMKSSLLMLEERVEKLSRMVEDLRSARDHPSSSHRDGEQVNEKAASIKHDYNIVSQNFIEPIKESECKRNANTLEREESVLPLMSYTP